MGSLSAPLQYGSLPGWLYVDSPVTSPDLREHHPSTRVRKRQGRQRKSVRSEVPRQFKS